MHVKQFKVPPSVPVTLWLRSGVKLAGSTVEWDTTSRKVVLGQDTEPAITIDLSEVAAYQVTSNPPP